MARADPPKNKGLGTPNGLFAALDAKGWMLVTSVAAVGKGLPWPCAAPSCLASGTFAAEKAAGWHTVHLGARNTTASISVDGDSAHVVQLDPTQAYATGLGGFASLVAPHMPVMYDNFTIDVSPASFESATSAAGGRRSSGSGGSGGSSVTVDGASASQCANTPAAGQKLISIGCGEASAALGSKWQIHGGDGGVGPISLRSDPTLCISGKGSFDAPATPASSSTAEIGLPVHANISTNNLNSNSNSGSISSSNIIINNNGVWNVSGHGHGVALSSDAKWAYWDSTPGGPGCDAVVLLSTVPAAPGLSGSVAGQNGAQVHWVHVQGAKGLVFADIGWCVPSINLEGDPHWMGFQTGTWIYRSATGYFKYGNNDGSQGVYVRINSHPPLRSSHIRARAFFSLFLYLPVLFTLVIYTSAEVGMFNQILRVPLSSSTLLVTSRLWWTHIYLPYSF